MVLIFPPKPPKKCVKVSHVIFDCRVINHHPSKFLDKNSAISEKGQKSSTKTEPFQKRVKILDKMVPLQHFSQKRVIISRQKWYHFRKFLKKNGTILGRKGSKFLNKKWYHFRQKRVKIPQQKWYHFRKGSKFIDKDYTISEKGQKSSTKMVPFQKRVKIFDKMVPFQFGTGRLSTPRAPASSVNISVSKVS